MKQLVIDILMKLAKMDVDAKELTAQVEAQSLLIAALMLTAGKDNSQSIGENVQNAIVTASRSQGGFLQTDVDLLLTHVNRLLAVTRYVDEMSEASD
ncbi:Anti-adapter protein IraP [Paramixta manurensis]|uniref:Anti-adapter protein IraP n=1 Tax=Paramixta manurensis TaxID=2740817 RepID=A0A6M8UD70_9GAMM|nr:Anti-adapter protein IraP [Erwiniaceae bacterium PD-1]